VERIQYLLGLNRFTKILLVFVFFVINLTYSQSFDGDRAYQFLVDQTDFGPRAPGSSGHTACLEYLAGKLEKAGAKVLRQPFMHFNTESGETITMTNIIGSFYPEKMNRIMLCAHWDTRPFADMDRIPNRYKPILGANDGASGVAVLLELALYLQKHEPPVGIDIIFFDGEDYGREGDLDNYCLGSRYFSQNNHGIFPRFAILLDMIGDAQLQIPREGYSQQFASQIVDLVWSAAENVGAYQFLPEVRHYVFDDHVILNEAGIPAIDIIDFEYPDVSHRFWHTMEDTPEKCSPQSLQTVGDVLIELIFNTTL
jgi:Zn-dependent M28 family amino/carboxypeptidase